MRRQAISRVAYAISEFLPEFIVSVITLVMIIFGIPIVAVIFRGLLL